MKKFEIFEHTADIGVIAYGKTLKQAFANTAYGMFSILIADLKQVQPAKTIQIEVSGNDLQEILVAFLSELLYNHTVGNLILNKFSIKEIGNKSLIATAKGEYYDPNKHEILHEIKTVTYHQLKIEKFKEEYFRIQVIFDI
jgi:SHS2 domain-containing protein